MLGQFLERPVSVLVPQGPGSEKASSLRLAIWFSSGSFLPRFVCQVPSGCISAETAVSCPTRRKSLQLPREPAAPCEGHLVFPAWRRGRPFPMEGLETTGIWRCGRDSHYRLPHLPRLSRRRHRSLGARPARRVCWTALAAGPAVPPHPTAFPNRGEIATVPCSSMTYSVNYPNLMTRTPHNPLVGPDLR